MIGAIAGDLAAWTYENDKEVFYSSLTSTYAELSPLGEAVLATAMWAINYRDGAQLRYGSEGDKFFIRHGARLIQLATLHWIFDHPNSLFVSDVTPFYDDKEGIYAANIIAEIIPGLRNGKTKAEILSDGFGKTFNDLKSSWQWQTVTERDGLLTYLMRAWDCFEKAWDFTSAIHNAARWEGVDRHLLCSLTGAIAEAMYGCEYRLLKKKYGENHYDYIQYPERIQKEVRAIQDFQFERRVFFPKNSALTNVEVHSWTPYGSRYKGMEISEEKYKLILRSLYTGWENRFGFYLDNGWIYTYRSGVLIARFRIGDAGDLYRIVNVQRSEEKPDFADDAINEALYSLSIN